MFTLSVLVPGNCATCCKTKIWQSVLCWQHSSSFQLGSIGVAVAAGAQAICATPPTGIANGYTHYTGTDSGDEDV